MTGEPPFRCRTSLNLFGNMVENTWFLESLYGTVPFRNQTLS